MERGIETLGRVPQAQNIEYLIKGFPLLQQLDNYLNPWGSCNLTCVAMCAYFFKRPRDDRYKRFSQFEDEMQQRAADKGWDRHEAPTMKQIAELYGMKDELTETSGWAETGKALYRAITHLQKGLPLIIHTYLTATGHIVCVDGVRLEQGKPVAWHIADPYGEFYHQGYKRNFGGDRDLGRYWLSHSTFTNLVLTDGIFWVHLISA